MDNTEISAAAFHNLAERYRDKYMDLTIYDASYEAFCALLPRGQARVLDAACGPGNVSRWLLRRRPDLEVLGIDLAPRMVELARAAAPSGYFIVHDCRRLAELKRPFDGIICAFGLPYFSRDEATAFIRAAAQSLRPGGALYLSTMLGSRDASGFQSYSTGDRIYVHYHDADHVRSTLQANGLVTVYESRIPSPNPAGASTQDLILIATTADRMEGQPGQPRMDANRRG